MTHPTARFPITTARDVTFVWNGPHPPAVIGDFDSWGEDPLLFRQSPLGDWRATLAVEPNAYLEYAFDRDGERFLDPLNSRSIPNGIGHLNSQFWMPEWRPSAALRRNPNVPAGQIVRHTIKDQFRLVGGKRDVWMYRPAVDDPLPLLVVFDGQDYLRRALLGVILDNLIAARRIRPVAALFIKHGGAARAVEYSCNGATAEFVHSVAVPFAEELCEGRLFRPHGVLGASMSGLMALYLGLLYPDTFPLILSQSGAFTESYGFGLLRRYLETAPPLPIRIWLNVGKYEFLREENRAVRNLLSARGYDMVYLEHSGGHNYISWRNEIEHGLVALFPPPA